ncbi:MAG: Uma2 family endonuclease [Blastocatellia bacterium]|nr:Uma2 family endonuclease [Blastocatellia bacterium]MBL8192410.1 Uma2 family endonuclease [Blastocatellia bacterium]MBN8724529.1 Uma2 family endonuclease [Acidobacteriota bacterium]
MSTNPIKKYTLKEYFEIEKNSNIKHEYVYGEIFSMVGASPNHGRIISAITSSLYPQLINTTCEVFTENMRTRTHNQIYRYPDFLITCNPRFININGLQSLINPTLIGEVLSDSTESFDQDAKFREYQQIESLRYYLLISQNEISSTLFTKNDNNWTSQTFTNLNDVIELPVINCRLNINDIYLRVQFQP